jgi:hypothetical protein
VSNNDVTMRGEVVRETEMAVYFRPRGHYEVVWLPKSQVAVVHLADGVSLTLPVWIAKQKDIYY